MTPMDYSEASLDDVDFATLASPSPSHPDHPPACSECGSSAETPDVHDESDDNLDDDSDSSVSTGNYSPPAWRRLGNGDRWYGTWRSGHDFLVRETPDKSVLLDSYYDTEVFEAARMTRLPTGSLTPEKECSPEPEAPSVDETLVKATTESVAPAEQEVIEESTEVQRRTRTPSMSPSPGRDNYIRFAVRADIQQHTAPIDATISFFQTKYHAITKSWTSFVLTILLAMLSMSITRALFQPMSLRAVPDLVKVAGLARSFEPLIYYSENGVSQVGDLQATGVAVWDLGESVRSSNMTSAPIIVKSLDELSDSLKTLAIELTKFFANVDGDIDSILIVMDWARRELSQLHSLPSPPLSTAFSNLRDILCAAGLLENPTTGVPTKFGTATTAVFGISQSQHTQQTLQRTFTEFLSVLEEAIDNELQHSLALFGLFEAIDRQFLNLARLVAREANIQDEQHADFLSSLWTRILGAKASAVKKYERNHQLLTNVREKTVRNKGILVEHNGKLLTLKANLESLRRKLVSPLVRSVNSSTLTLEDQIKGLEDVGVYLEGVRARQKGKLMEMLYGDRSRIQARVAATASARLLD
ncbi:hypothetical protein ONZ43_g3092 [Nemania bipapillata]|uniref:Uncharacterized protein n=1 Tax=Nemania bipapillata TaxID=110536 RepID=A0ACC2IY22_9PEZI|nr:hypothetical protein ONZ43_g3092 [Nemania bipapillata]